MNIHETLIFIRIYMPTHKHILHHMYKYISTDILTRLPMIMRRRRRGGGGRGGGGLREEFSRGGWKGKLITVFMVIAYDRTNRVNRLFGIVVKTSASRAGLESRFYPGLLFRVESYQ